jgi:GNAT superfamily N-acetyltransferase
MQPEHLDSIVQMMRDEGWTPTRGDLSNVLSYEPEGCFIAEVKGEIVGSVTTTLYTHFGWIGMMMVRKDLRRHRIGSTLLEAALRYFKEKGSPTARLEADPPGVPLYERFGFVKECESQRWFGDPFKIANVPGTGRATKADLEAVFALDKQAFGDDRCRVLKRLFDYSDFVFKVRRDPALGIIMGRKTAVGTLLGPFIAANADVAKRLLRWAIGFVEEGQAYVGIPETSGNARLLLATQRFKMTSVLTRMYWGDPPRSGNPQLEYGIAASATG